MARLARLTFAQHQHHIIQRGNDKQLIFRDADDYRFFISLLLQGAKKFEVAIHAYVLMSNHFHLMATPSTDTGLGSMMQWVGRYYVPYYNRRYERTGTLWQGRFKSIVLDSEQYFMLCSRYIELNPVRAGMVMSPADYVWSSYLHNVGAKLDPLVTDHPLYWRLGNTPFQREVAYRELVDQSLSAKEIAHFRDACKKGWPLGSTQFKERLEKQSESRIAPLRKGRPRLISPDTTSSE